MYNLQSISVFSDTTYPVHSVEILVKDKIGRPSIL